MMSAIGIFSSFSRRAAFLKTSHCSGLMCLMLSGGSAFAHDGLDIDNRSGPVKPAFICPASGCGALVGRAVPSAPHHGGRAFCRSAACWGQPALLLSHYDHTAEANCTCKMRPRAADR